MGCDIHLHSEVKRKGKWLHHSQQKVERNYMLFAKMGEPHRNDFGIIPISAPKGLPHDATELTLLHSEKFGPDGHSHSWLNAKEISELHAFIESPDNPESWFEGRCNDRLMWSHDNMPYFMGNHLSGFFDYPEDFEGTGIEDVRYVFFFDN